MSVEEGEQDAKNMPPKGMTTNVVKRFSEMEEMIKVGLKEVTKELRKDIRGEVDVCKGEEDKGEDEEEVPHR